MKTYSIAWINEAPTGTHIDAFTGKITRVGKHNFGTARGRDGSPMEWSFQDLQVKDATGAELTVTLDKREELPNDWAGAEVMFTASQTQHGMKGLIVEDTEAREKNGKVYPSIRRLRVTPTGNIEDVTGRPKGQQQAPQGQQRRQQEQAPQERQQTRQEPTQHRQQEQRAGQGQQAQQGGALTPPTRREKADTALKNYRGLVARISVLKQISHNAAVANAHALWINHGVKTEQGGVGAEGTSIFIESMRRLGDAGVNFMDLPYVLPAPHKDALRLDKLYEMERPPFPTDKTPEEVRAMEAEHRAKQAAAQAPAQQAQPRPTQHRQQPAAQQPADNGHWDADSPSDGPSTWQAALEDDDIPF